MRKVLSILIMALVLINSVAIAAENDKNAVYDKLKKQYGDLKSISLKFSMVGLTEFTGTLKAKKGNKFLFQTKDRIVVSNGKTVWNHSLTDKNVIISSYDTKLSESSVEQFFFSFLDNYSPSDLKKENTSGGASNYVLTLIPKNAKSTINGVKYIKVWISDSNGEIKKIGFKNGPGEQVWELKSITVNPKLNESLFEYKVPKGMEQMDLR